MQCSEEDWRDVGTQEDNPFAMQGSQGGEVVSEVDSGRSFTDSEGERLRPQVQAGYARQATGSVGPGGHGSWWSSQRRSGSTAGNYVKEDGSDPEPDLLHGPLGGLVRPGKSEPGGLPTTWPLGTTSCPLVWPARASDREMVHKHWPDRDSWPMLKDKEKCVRGFVANFEAALYWKAAHCTPYEKIWRLHACLGYRRQDEYKGLFGVAHVCEQMRAGNGANI